ncbi:MAG: hypothetical protein HC903_16380 [Methylacidiphilales bacterium]|nr:hypothetical protein [Candidatus Methylacidiphilales bacterium]NJR19400.1 hypothetical protein [Calothrix sp. CSU_2_0]
MFTETQVTENTRQALLNFWRDSIIKLCTPHSYLNFYTREQTVSIWWLHWLLDSITSEKTGKAWFGEQAIAWLANLPGDRGELGGEYGVLRLLTKDLSDILYQGKCPYPKFYEVVVAPSQQSTPDDTSRRKYLQEYAPLDLWERVMDYWRANLHNFVPKPEMSQNSDYSTNAAWMSALKELSPQSYQRLLSEWKVNHQRRRNLWKAMGSLGLM